jgi:predicted GNAT superfamily acetyltransferase
MSVAPETCHITISELDHAAQMHDVEALQKEVWGVPDVDVVPLTQLVAARAAGGVLMGAFDGTRMVGFIYGFPSFERGQLAHHSHMLAVSPAYRNYNLGWRLKLAQREHVIAQGIELMTWTFDPLQSLNAHFNFCKLGVLSDRYLPNFYGEDAQSFLHRNGTDRLWCSWLLSSGRVKRRVNERNRNVFLDLDVPLVQVVDDGSPRRNRLANGVSTQYTSIEIPADINSLQEQKSEIALRWREETRWAFTEALKAGYTVAEFVRETRGEQRVGRYVLSKGKLSDFA